MYKSKTHDDQINAKEFASPYALYMQANIWVMQQKETESVNCNISTAALVGEGYGCKLSLQDCFVTVWLEEEENMEQQCYVQYNL